MLSNHKNPVNNRLFPSRLTIRCRNDNMDVKTLSTDEEGSMQFHLVDGKNVNWTDERRARFAITAMQSRFQFKRLFQIGLLFEMELFDHRNTVKKRHAHGRYQITSSLPQFWTNLEKELVRFFVRVDGQAKNFDFSIFEMRIGGQTYFRHKFKTYNDKRLVLILGFSKMEEPKSL